MYKKSNVEIFTDTLQNGTTTSSIDSCIDFVALHVHIRCDVEITLKVYFNHNVDGKHTDNNLEHEEVIPADTYVFRSLPVCGSHFNIEIENANPTGTDNLVLEVIKSKIPYYKVV